MTDGRSAIAGKYPQQFPLEITAILNEGAITVTSTAYDRANTSDAAYAFAAELVEGDYVALSNDTDNTYAATGGIPVVEKAVNGEQLVIGKLVSAPHALRALPASSGVADTWTKRLAAKYYRLAKLQVHAGITEITKATVMCNGSNACAIGVGSTLKFNITGAYGDHCLSFDSAASGGTGVIPFHYVAASSDGDEYTILCGINDMLTAVTGA
jgi:hypothetical protein